MANETVSVIVPVYNVASELPRCVESVLHQTYPHLELILVDDGSTDGSGGLCDEFAHRDPRVKVIHKPNGGVSAARNIGVTCAAGTYLSFLDSDDYVESQLLEKMVHLMQSLELDIGAFGLFINDTPVQKFPAEEAAELPACDAVRNVVTDGGDNLFIGSVCNKFFRRSTMGHLLRFDSSLIMAEDMLVTLQCLTAAQKVGQLTWSGYHYVQRETSIVHTYKKNKCSSAIAHEKMEQLLQPNFSDCLPLLRRRNIWQNFVLLMEQIRHDVFYPEDVAVLLSSLRKCRSEIQNTDMSRSAKLRLRLMMVFPGLPRLLHLLYRVKKIWR